MKKISFLIGCIFCVFLASCAPRVQYTLPLGPTPVLGVVETTPSPQVTSDLQTVIAYSPDRRTGITVVDAVIEIVLANNRAALLSLVSYTTAGCTHREGLGGPPKCQSDQAEGTFVEGFPVEGPDGYFIQPNQIDTAFTADSNALIAVYRVAEDVYAEPYWPGGNYGIVFTNRQFAWAMVILVDDTGIVKVAYGELSRVLSTRSVSEFVLPPLLTETPIPIPQSTTSFGGLKPPDNDSPVSGICAEPLGEIVEFTLTADGPAMPRCAKVMGAQRIKLINATGAVVQVKLAHFKVSIPADGSFLLDQRVDEYLAPGVHFVNGAEVWVIANLPPPNVTAPPPIIAYSNYEVGYRLSLYGDWNIDESGMTNGTNKEVIFSPPYSTEPFITYLSISLDFRTLDQIINSYAQNVPDATREDVNFYSYPGIKYIYNYGRNEYFIPYGGQIFLIATDRPNDGTIQLMLMNIQLLTPAFTFEITMADTGRTLNMIVGESFLLNLGSDFYDWSVALESENVLSREPNVTVNNSAQGIYQTHTPGTATLTALGNPKCINLTPPCMTPSIMFMIAVIVQ